ncbi:MAG TPA: ATP-dependent helicase [Gemmatimonadales bacterium]|nr:ATP-dependent helicase [Gemmatimonadales bacterium]
MPPVREPRDTLNSAQQAAVQYGTEGLPDRLPGPLLVIAGAGTGKTNTLAHRVAELLLKGALPERMLLLTFTRRAAEIMTRRAERIVTSRDPNGGRARRVWSGTFHAVANRVLRLHAAAIGLDPAFTVLDRSDSADLLDVVRSDLGLAKQPTRFPQKGTCQAIYSHAVNSSNPVEQTLAAAFPAYVNWTDELKRLFRGYVAAKERRHLLDYDDLLLYWFHLMQEHAVSDLVRRRFDHVLVDEYQDTNALQAGILLGLKPDGRGLMVVGDDAQSIYAFRGATVRNILDFPARFQPPAHVITLEHNYRSVQPILDAANAAIALTPEGFTKRLVSTRASEQKPLLVSARDEQAQADDIVARVLAHREAGIALHRQAVLMRAAHHSDLLEIELGRHNIPFVKYGGLKFLEAAHVKDVLAILRWVENPRDSLASFRVLQLLPGLGPAHARRIEEQLAGAGFDLSALARMAVPASARLEWPRFAALLEELRGAGQWAGQFGRVREWYEPRLERLYGAAEVRAADLIQLEHVAADHPTRESFLSDLTLDPPNASGDLARDPLLDEDYLILSTIHSAKGQEWDVVYVLNVVDGCIPSDMASGGAGEIEEERRLLYVALTRARDFLYVMQPHRFYTHGRSASDQHVYAPRSRFLPESVTARFESVAHRQPAERFEGSTGTAVVDLRARMREMWQ